MSVSSVQVEVDWRSRLPTEVVGYIVDKVIKVVKDSDVHYKGNTAVPYLGSASAKEVKDD